MMERHIDFKNVKFLNVVSRSAQALKYEFFLIPEASLHEV